MATLATLASVMSVASTVAGVVGTIGQANAQKAQGEQALATANYQAQLAERKGKEEFALKQREAMEIKRERERALGQQTAIAATSGLGTLDETVLALNADVIEESSLRQSNAMYEGASARAGYYEQAQATRIEGVQARDGYRRAASGTILGGVGRMAGKLAGSFAALR